jgi:hypothetical protein
MDIVAAPDRVKAVRGRFVAPEKKTGVPTGRGVEAPAKKAGAAKAAAGKTARKSAAVRRRRSA